MQPDGAPDRIEVDFLGLPIEQRAYVYILGTLGAGGYLDEDLGTAGVIDCGSDHYTCFPFAYDWRRDNIENARRLRNFLLEKRAFVRRKMEESGEAPDKPVKFDLVAHSMGGLVARYFLRYGAAALPADGSLPELTWAGADLVDHAILVAPPNAGSAEAMLELRNGLSFAPILPSVGAAILGTMPSIYQLLPRPRHGALILQRDGEDRPADLLDPDLWEQQGWGLADPSLAKSLATLLPEVSDPARRRERADG